MLTLYVKIYIIWMGNHIIYNFICRALTNVGSFHHYTLCSLYANMSAIDVLLLNMELDGFVFNILCRVENFVVLFLSRRQIFLPMFNL